LSNNVFIKEAVRTLYQALILAMQRHFNQGSPSNAYKMFSERFAQSRRGTEYAMLSPDSFLTSKTLNPTDVLYRLRLETQYAPDAAGMFHIPFEKRYLVGSKRFSIAGYPCIYAASSVYLAYRELRNPGWTPNLYAAKLRAVNNEIGMLRLLDLRNNVEEIRHRYSGRPASYDGRLLRFFATWPLVMATSIPILDSDIFHEEYVIPQLVLEWVNDTGDYGGKRFFSGIAFSSSRMSLTEPAHTNAYNVVIPVHHSNPRGLCEIRTQQLQVSLPITLEDIIPQIIHNVDTDEEHAQIIQDALQNRSFENIHH
jgi:hypothetical protein